MYINNKKTLKSIKDSKEFLQWLNDKAAKTEAEKALFKNALIALEIAAEVLQNSNNQ